MPRSYPAISSACSASGPEWVASFSRPTTNPARPTRLSVLSHDYWTAHFGRNPSILNQAITLNNRPFTVVGIAPEGFRGILSGNAPELFISIAAHALISPGTKDYNRPDLSMFTILGRLAPGVPRERAQAELQPIFASTVRDQLTTLKITNKRSRAHLEATALELNPAARGLNEMERQWRKPLLVLSAMVSLLLLIGCSNLANLLLARGVNRSRDTAIRFALGARRSRIVSMLLAESLLVSAAGAGLGLLLTPWLTSGVLHLLPQDAAGGWLTNQVSVPVLAFCTGLMVAAGLLSGIAPAWQSARAGDSSMLGDRTAATGGAHLSPRIRQALIVGQLALSLVLLSTAALFGKSLINLMRQNPGFRPENVLTFSLDAGQRGYTPQRGMALYRRIEDRLRSLPDVDSVSIARIAPMSGSSASTNVTVEGYTAAEGENTDAEVNGLEPGFFRTLGTPLIAGREFDLRDGDTAPKVAIVNQAFVRRFIKTRNPVGLHMTRGSGTVKLDTEIVGVVPDIKNLSLREQPKPAYFQPFEQAQVGDPEASQAVFVVRSRTGDKTLTASVRAAIAQIERALPVFQLQTMSGRINDSIYTDRLLAALATAFGLLALLLTAIGLYGVISYVVGRRTSEIGVRMALGATASDIMRLILREVAVLTAAGILLGTCGAWISSRAVSSQLFGFQGFNLWLITAAIALLSLVSLIAGTIPALRAAQIQPLEALRHE